MNIKRLLLLLLVFTASYCCYAQTKPAATNAFTVTGLVDSTRTITYAAILKEQPVSIDSFIVKNHEGKFKKAYSNLQGVPLLKLLRDVHILSPGPKVLSEYYLVFKASDGYAVVYSWNEIFNTPVGESIFIITTVDGKPLLGSNDRILVICTSDNNTGRRHIKGLASIEVKRIAG